VLIDSKLNIHRCPFPQNPHKGLTFPLPSPPCCRAGPSSGCPWISKEALGLVTWQGERQYETGPKVSHPRTLASRSLNAPCMQSEIKPPEIVVHLRPVQPASYTSHCVFCKLGHKMNRVSAKGLTGAFQPSSVPEVARLDLCA
jgi:hypothetical protein